MMIRWQRLHQDAVVPEYAYPGDVGADLTVVEGAVLEPAMSADLAIGWAMELPLGFWGRITGRSSTFRKRGLLVNEGVIDQGYRGPLFINVLNLSLETKQVQPGDKLAQLIVETLVRPQMMEVEVLGESIRGSNGFGSSGLRVER